MRCEPNTSFDYTTMHHNIYLIIVITYIHCIYHHVEINDVVLCTVLIVLYNICLTILSVSLEHECHIYNYVFTSTDVIHVSTVSVLQGEDGCDIQYHRVRL